MTHSLHRRGNYEDLKDDFVVLGCPATGVNKKGSAPKTRKFLSICYKHGPVNLGDMKTGNIHNTTMGDILDRVTRLDYQPLFSRGLGADVTISKIVVTAWNDLYMLNADYGTVIWAQSNPEGEAYLDGYGYYKAAEIRSRRLLPQLRKRNSTLPMR